MSLPTATLVQFYYKIIIYLKFLDTFRERQNLRNYVELDTVKLTKIIQFSVGHLSWWQWRRGPNDDDVPIYREVSVVYDNATCTTDRCQ